MATFTLYDEFLRYLADGTIDLDTHVFKAMLTNSAPNQNTHTVKTDVTEITAGNGYTAGGATLASVTWSETAANSGIWRFNSTSPSFTAAGGAIATHQYLVIYDDTPSAPADPLVGWVDRGSSATIADGNTRTWSLSTGWFDVDATP
jgi:hypothetical protein